MARRADRLSVAVIRSGGVAAVRREWRATAEGQHAAELQALVESIPWESIPVHPAAPDRFVWSITVTGSGARRRVTVPETVLDGALRELVAAVQRLGDAEGPPATGPGRRAV